MKNNIKICHVIHSFDFGGIQKLLHDLCSLQIKNDKITVNILVIKKNGKFLEKFQSLDVDISTLGMKKIYHFGLGSLKKTLKVFKNSDVVHFHNFHPVINFLAFVYNKKVIYTEHGNFAFGRKKRITDLFSIMLRVFYLKYFPLQIVANSNFTNFYLRNNLRINNKNIITIHNGVQKINKISQKNVIEIRNKYKNQFIIGTTSRLAGFKRIDRLITAFQILYKKNSNVVLLIIGEGIEKSALKELVKKNDVRNVYFLGYKKNVHDYQSAFDICVFPSENEPFGLVAVESYFNNKPTLVFNDGGGLKEIVSMVNKNDIVESEEELAKRIQYYIDNEIKTVKNTKILNFFSAKRMEEDYLNCYI